MSWIVPIEGADPRGSGGRCAPRGWAPAILCAVGVVLVCGAMVGAVVLVAAPGFLVALGDIVGRGPS